MLAGSSVNTLAVKHFTAEKGALEMQWTAQYRKQDTPSRLLPNQEVDLMIISDASRDLAIGIEQWLGVESDSHYPCRWCDGRHFSDEHFLDGPMALTLEERNQLP